MENRINSLMYKGFETGFFIGFRIYDVKAHISRYKTLARDIVFNNTKLGEVVDLQGPQNSFNFVSF